MIQRIKQVFFLCHFTLDSSKKGQKRAKNGRRRIFGQYSRNPMGQVGFEDLGGGVDRF